MAASASPPFFIFGSQLVGSSADSCASLRQPSPLVPSSSPPLATALQQQLDQQQVEIADLRSQLQETQAATEAQVAELAAAKASQVVQVERANELQQLLVAEAEHAVVHAERLVAVEGRLLGYKRELEEREETESERVELELAKRLCKISKKSQREAEAAAGIAVEAAVRRAEKAEAEVEKKRAQAVLHVKEKKAAVKKAKRLGEQLEDADKKLRLLDSESSKFWLKVMEVGKPARPSPHARAHTLPPPPRRVLTFRRATSTPACARSSRIR